MPREHGLTSAQRALLQRRLALRELSIDCRTAIRFGPSGDFGRHKRHVIAGVACAPRRHAGEGFLFHLRQGQCRRLARLKLIAPGLVARLAYSSSRYSPGTSSSGTSRVRTSFPSRPLEFSTPANTPASNAFPSSNNSSTLSESALSTFDRPSRSPDCNPETSREDSSELSSWPLFRLVLRTALALFVFAGTLFLATVLSGTVFLFANRFCAGRSGFLAALFFDLVDFFLVFFLVAIRAV